MADLMDVSIAQKLPEIFSLALDRTEPARIRLASLLSDVFQQSTQLSPREQEMVNQIIDELIGKTSPDVKRMLAEKLANSPGVSHRVLITLASDASADVAAPILKNNPLLQDDDLIYVVEAYGGEHAHAVAERQAINEAVVDALIATGEITVMATVAENLGAKISSHAMNVLIEAARFGHKLHEPLINRPELTRDMSMKLIWWLKTELRRQVIKRFNINGGQADSALESSVNELLSKIESDRGDEFAMVRIAEWLEEREAVSPRVMIQALRMGFFKLYAILVAHKTKMDALLVERMITEDGGRSFAVLCRAMEVEKPNFVSMFLLSRGARDGEQIVNPRELSQAIAVFDKLDYPTAVSLIHTWRQDPSYLLHRLHESVH